MSKSNNKILKKYMEAFEAFTNKDFEAASAALHESFVLSAKLRLKE